MKKFKLWGGLLALFLSGILTGVAGSRIVSERWGMRLLEGPRPPFHRMIMKRLDRELSLNEEQERRIGEIVRQSQLEMMELRRRHEPEIEQVLARGIMAMKGELSPQQQKQLDQFVEREKARRAKRERDLREDGFKRRDP